MWVSALVVYHHTPDMQARVSACSVSELFATISDSSIGMPDTPGRHTSVTTPYDMLQHGTKSARSTELDFTCQLV